jgi:hypothetical protein
MKVRYPINLISKNVNDILPNVSALLNASKVLKVQQGTKLEDVYFVGPFKLVKDLYAKQNDFDKGSLRILIDESTNKKGENKDQKIIANGAYLPSDYKGNLPFLMIYKRIEALDGKPVLISENYLTPGELVVVHEASEFFAVLFYNDGQVCKIPDKVEWFSWYSDEVNNEIETTAKTTYRINYDKDYLESDYRDGKIVELKTPLLDCNPIEEQLIDWNESIIQVTPILSEADANELLNELKSCKAWVRRTGENNILYTQETFDILEYSQKQNAPKIFGELINKLQSEKLLKIMSKLSGMELTALREVYAFHMQANEFITKHADSTLDGQLLVRFNWLLQSPTARQYDLRFWKGKDSEKPITRYKALPNSATIFYVGDTTPHDLTPLPEDCDKDRYNIVLTFGHKAK